ncbi:fibroblast growth factor receptor substrate 2a [Engraulis encrasicolus]|uniref:fibroblast growth factor receptor substrate 2a n=1 Tax=Engraulis encrasicolus TaxID=184585 RepID=UPI002FD01EF1
MGSCCSCPDKDSIPDNHQSKFKVINVDDDGNELGSGVMELTEEELILHTRKRHAVRWPYLCLRRYGYDSNLFSFESGRRCQTGQGIFAFKCARAEEIFNMLQDIMHSNSISVVEEPVQEISPAAAAAAAAAQTAEPTTTTTQTPTEVPRTPHTPTTPGYSVPTMANGIGRYPSFGDPSSRPSSRHPSVGSARLPSVGEESTHPLLVSDETVHTYVNTTGVQEDRRSRGSVHAPLDLRLSNPDSLVGGHSSSLANDTALAAEGHVLLEPEGVAKFVLGPTPVQRQREAAQRVSPPPSGGGGRPTTGDTEPTTGPLASSSSSSSSSSTTTSSSTSSTSSSSSSSSSSQATVVNGSTLTPTGPQFDCDTGYDSDERKEAANSSTSNASATNTSSAAPGAKTSTYEHQNGSAATPNPNPTANGTAKPTPGPVLPTKPSLPASTTGSTSTTTTTTTITGVSSGGIKISTGARRIRPPLPLPDPHNANNSAQRRTALLNYENLPALPPVWETRKSFCEAEGGSGGKAGGKDEVGAENTYTPKTPSLNNGYHHHHSSAHHHHSHHGYPHHQQHQHQHTPHPMLHHGLDPLHNYVNTENVTVPLSAHKPDSARPPRRDCSASQQPTVFNFDFRRGGGGIGGSALSSTTTGATAVGGYHPHHHHHHHHHQPEPPRQLNYIEVEMENNNKGSDSSGPHTPKTPTTPLLQQALMPQTPTRRTELYAVIDIERTAAMSSLQKALPRDDGTARKTRHNSTDLPM